jgi:hypothetical protein
MMDIILLIFIGLLIALAWCGIGFVVGWFWGAIAQVGGPRERR